MMQRKQERAEDVGFRNEQARLTHEETTARRMEQGGQNYWDQLQRGIENRRADKNLMLNEKQVNAQVESTRALAEERRLQAQQIKNEKSAYAQLGKEYPNLAPYFGAIGAGASPSSLGPLLSSMGSLTGNETLDRMVMKGFEDLVGRTDVQGNPVPVQSSEIRSLLDNVKQVGSQFNQQSDGLAEPVEQSKVVLEKMQGIAEGKQNKNSKGLGRLNPDEALQVLAIDNIFDPSDKTGNDLALERARDLFDEGFIDLKTFRALLEKMGMDSRGRHPMQILGERLGARSGRMKMPASASKGLGDVLRDPFPNQRPDDLARDFGLDEMFGGMLGEK
jgi:hypothetical protein